MFARTSTWSGSPEELQKRADHAASKVKGRSRPGLPVGLDADALRAAVLPRLEKAVPIDAPWWAAADLATLLFTQPYYREELPEESGPYFIASEFLQQDVTSGPNWPATRRACAR